MQIAGRASDSSADRIVLTRSFPTQRLWKRFAIVLAGPLSNIIFAPILMTIVFMIGRADAAAGRRSRPRRICPAHAAGLAAPAIASWRSTESQVETWNEFSAGQRRTRHSDQVGYRARAQGAAGARARSPSRPSAKMSRPFTATRRRPGSSGCCRAATRETERYGPIERSKEAVSTRRNDGPPGHRNRQIINGIDAGAPGAGRADHDRADGRQGGA